MFDHVYIDLIFSELGSIHIDFAYTLVAIENPREPQIQSSQKAEVHPNEGRATALIASTFHEGFAPASTW